MHTYPQAISPTKMAGMEEKIKELLPELQQNPTAVNESLIYALQALKTILVQLGPIEQTVELIQNKTSNVMPKPDQLQQAKAALTCLDLSRLIAARLNCTDENMLQLTLKWLGD